MPESLLNWLSCFEEFETDADTDKSARIHEIRHGSSSNVGEAIEAGS